MIGRKHSTSSNRWLWEHFNDKYVQQANKKGLRSRAWFKLNEIHQSDKLFKSGMTVIDLGSAPGGWSQYAIEQISSSGRIIACDLLPMDPIVGVDFFQGDFRDESVFKSLIRQINDRAVQVVMSDMSPNICGISAIDIPRVIYLAELALEMCHNVLMPDGKFLVKLFQGEGFEEYLKKIRSLFTKVKIRKPYTSRVHSREVYVIASGKAIIGQF